jgi:hypothetical protein
MQRQLHQDYNEDIYMFIFLLFFSGCIFSMQENSYVVQMPSATAAASGGNDLSDIFASPEEKDELFQRALSYVYNSDGTPVNDQLKVYLDRVVCQHCPDCDQDLPIKESGIAVLRRLKSGDVEEQHENYIKRLVMKATCQAFEDQQKKLEKNQEEFEKQQKKLESKISKKTTTIISLFASIVASVTTAIIAVYSK